MKRTPVLLAVAVILMSYRLGSANPNGVGQGTFDAQCGGACHGDADMNRSSSSTVVVHAPETAYEGLPTSVSVTITDVETTVSGLLGVFLLSDLSGADDTPADAGWTILSNSEGGDQNYVEITVAPGETERTVTWTLRAPSLGEHPLHAAIHHGTESGEEAPFFGASTQPAVVEVVAVPENLPRLSPSFAPPVSRDVGEASTLLLQTVSVQSVDVEWRLNGGPVNTVVAASAGVDAWTFDLPPSLQPASLEWRALLSGEGPDQTTPWFTLQSEEPSWEVDETAAYVQSMTLLFVFMVAYMSLHRRSGGPQAAKYDAFEEVDG
ncbi:MAG: hypothetical protein VXX16_04830 [Candidatus Thermoplasmatota archaeon]|nr:hypothetical protein [Candidatus Thermoplasmatota archaeon]